MLWIRRDAVVVRTTMPDEKSARKLATALVDAKLAACVHVYQVFSTYDWKGVREGETEWYVEARTLPAKWRKAMERMRADHPYELPMIESTGYAVMPDYAAWMKHALA